MTFDEKIAELVQAYIKAHHNGEFDDNPDEMRYHDLIKERQDWLRENILDLEKLRGYTNTEFEEKIYEMLEHTEGGNSTHARVKGTFRKNNPESAEIRTKFENIVAFITSPRVDRFAALGDLESKDGKYDIKGLGKNTLTALVNAQYPDVPIVNDTTEIFFRNIGKDLPKNITQKQREAHQLFAKMIEGANGEIDFIDANHVCWYTQKVESGIDFMKVNFNVSPENKTIRKPGGRNIRKLTPEEKRAELIAHFQTIHEQAERERSGKM